MATASDTSPSTLFFGTFQGVAGSGANVQAGGAIIDTNSFTDTIAQALQHDATGTDGGLIKEGAGTLILTGANTYNGGTVVGRRHAEG